MWLDSCAGDRQHAELVPVHGELHRAATGDGQGPVSLWNTTPDDFRGARVPNPSFIVLLKSAGEGKKRRW